jgi:hypothetical protein
VHFDAVISSAVLHFAKNEQHFSEMLSAMWRKLMGGGLFSARLASSTGSISITESNIHRRLINFPKYLKLVIVSRFMPKLCTKFFFCSIFFLEITCSLFKFLF